MGGLNKDEINRIIYDNGLFHGTMALGVVMDADHLERFANLVAAAERGAICALLDRLVNWYEDIDRQGSAEDIRKLIQHIRIRGNDAT